MVDQRIPTRALLGDHSVSGRSRRLSEVSLVDSEVSGKPCEIRRIVDKCNHSSFSENVNTYRFSLLLSGVSEITPELADGLYEACHGDIEFHVLNGVATLEFDREASDLDEGIRAAIREAEGANLGVRVIRVDSEESNTVARVNAELLTATQAG